MTAGKFRRLGPPTEEFLDWPAIEAWAEGVARELQPAATAAGTPA
jgi:hypothetical protein